MKRFWTAAEAVQGADGWGVLLDQRPLKTPARVSLKVPHRRLAEAIAAEWAASGEMIDPRAMPLTGLANAAIDRVAPDPAGFAATIGHYAEADLLCYRAESPRALVDRQAVEWDPLLDWARDRFDVEFAVTTGIVHVAQPEQTRTRLREAVRALDPFRLAALSPIVTIGGSLVTAFALVEGAVEFDQAWRALSLDDGWQIERWGADTDAVAMLASRRAEIAAADVFVGLLD